MFVKILRPHRELSVHPVTQLVDQCPLLLIRLIARAESHRRAAPPRKTGPFIDLDLDALLRELELGDLLHPSDDPVSLRGPDGSIFVNGGVESRILLVWTERDRHTA